MYDNHVMNIVRYSPFYVRKAGFLWWPHVKKHVKWRVYYFTCLHKLVDSYVDFAGVTNILNHFTCKFTIKEHLRTNLMHRKRRALSRLFARLWRAWRRWLLANMVLYIMQKIYVNIFYNGMTRYLFILCSTYTYVMSVHNLPLSIILLLDKYDIRM